MTWRPGPAARAARPGARWAAPGRSGSAPDAAADADLLIAEAYYQDKSIPYHLRLADLDAHRDQLTARRVILTHMSSDMLASNRETPFETAYDGLTFTL
jgi:phosphoribosyl 1,2-cyclic phosphodiesterase